MRGLVATLEKHHNVRILERGGRRRGAALEPLHLRPAAARQGGQPARHDLRPHRHQPDRRRRRRSRTAAGASSSSTSPIDILEREEATGADARRADRELHSRAAAGRRNEARGARTSAGRRRRSWSRKIRELRDQLEGRQAPADAAATHGKVRRREADAAAAGRAAAAAAPTSREQLLGEAGRRRAKLPQLQGESPARASPASIAGRSPRRSPPGPAFRSAAWSPTRSTRCSTSRS